MNSDYRATEDGRSTTLRRGRDLDFDVHDPFREEGRVDAEHVETVGELVRRDGVVLDEADNHVLVDAMALKSLW